MIGVESLMEICFFFSTVCEVDWYFRVEFHHIDVTESFCLHQQMFG